MTRRRRRPTTLEEHVDLLLAVVLSERWLDRIPRSRLHLADYPDLKRRTQVWIDEHRDEVAEAIAKVNAKGIPWACAPHVADELWPAFFVWVRGQEPDVFERPAGMY